MPRTPAPLHREPDPAILALVRVLARKAAREDHARDTALKEGSADDDSR